MSAPTPAKRPRVAPIWLREVQSSRQLDSIWLKELAREAGLEVASISGPEPFDGLEAHLHEQIERGHLVGFDWFTPERATVSASPAHLHAGVRSIVSVGLPYYRPWPEPDGGNELRGRIARYAWGTDYHQILKRRMAELLRRLEDRAGRTIEGRLLVDTARIVDRAVASRSGLGWYGKHTCVIVPGFGSWVLLGELLLDLELEPDAPLDRNCGRCRACLDICPTGALVGAYELDSGKCISFQTIEQRGVIPVDIRPLMGGWVFGCDECQEICPYTGPAREHFDSELEPASRRNIEPELRWLLEMSESEFREVYRGTAVLRTKRRGVARNAAIALGNSRDERAIAPLAEALAGHDEPLVRGHAAWALGRLDHVAAGRALQLALDAERDDYVRSEIIRAREGPAG